MAARKTKLRIFIIESTDPMDLLQDRSEREALEKVCKLIGHEVATFEVKSKQEFKTICKYLSSIDEDHDSKKRKKVPLCIHISTHGNDEGLGFGYDFISWRNLFKMLQPLCSEMDSYSGSLILIISACGADSQSVTKEFETEYGKNNKLNPPTYLFITTGNPNWDDALVSWVNFYHQLPTVKLYDKKDIQKVLNKAQVSRTIKLRYFRWDNNDHKYKKYTSG